MSKSQKSNKSGASSNGSNGDHPHWPSESISSTSSRRSSAHNETIEDFAKSVADPYADPDTNHFSKRGKTEDSVVDVSVGSRNSQIPSNSKNPSAKFEAEKERISVSFPNVSPSLSVYSPRVHEPIKILYSAHTQQNQHSAPSPLRYPLGVESTVYATTLTTHQTQPYLPNARGGNWVHGGQSHWRPGMFSPSPLAPQQSKPSHLAYTATTAHSLPSSFAKPSPPTTMLTSPTTILTSPTTMLTSQHIGGTTLLPSTTIGMPNMTQQHHSHYPKRLAPPATYYPSFPTPLAQQGYANPKQQQISNLLTMQTHSNPYFLEPPFQTYFSPHDLPLQPASNLHSRNVHFRNRVGVPPYRDNSLVPFVGTSGASGPLAFPPGANAAQAPVVFDIYDRLPRRRRVKVKAVPQEQTWYPLAIHFSSAE